MRPSLQAASDGIWGEHEIDYILFCRPKTMPRIRLNSNEISHVLEFTRQELADWVAAAPSRYALLLWMRFV